MVTVPSQLSYPLKLEIYLVKVALWHSVRVLLFSVDSTWQCSLPEGSASNFSQRQQPNIFSSPVFWHHPNVTFSRLSLDFLPFAWRKLNWRERDDRINSIVWIEDDIPISVRGLRWEWPVFERTTFGCGDISELAGHGYHSTIALCVLNGVKYLFKS